MKCSVCGKIEIVIGEKRFGVKGYDLRAHAGEVDSLKLEMVGVPNA